MSVDIVRLNKQLTAAGVAAVGVGLPAVVHETAGPATFHNRPDGQPGKVRIDWVGAPSAAQTSAAATVVAAHTGPIVDDDVNTLRVPVKLLAAVVLAMDSVPPAVKNNWPAWVVGTINRGAARITAALNGRTPGNVDD